jgi:hypothetical protein
LQGASQRFCHSKGVFAPPGRHIDCPGRRAAHHLLAVVDQLTADTNGGFFDWRGQPVPW